MTVLRPVVERAGQILSVFAVDFARFKHRLQLAPTALRSQPLEHDVHLPSPGLDEKSLNARTPNAINAVSPGTGIPNDSPATATNRSGRP
jgi:hypothetical protein